MKPLKLGWLQDHLVGCRTPGQYLRGIELKADSSTNSAEQYSYSLDVQGVENKLICAIAESVDAISDDAISDDAIY